MSDQWIRVASEADLEDDGVMQVVVNDQPVALYRLDGKFFATQDICPHGQAFLSQGWVEDECVECPLHQALFHIPTGEVREGPAKDDICVFPIRVEDGDVFVSASADVSSAEAT